MSNEDIAWNGQALKAWNRWKETCSVANLKNEDAQVNGAEPKKYSAAEIEELTDWQIKLSAEIKNAFENKFASLLGDKSQWFKEVMKKYEREHSFEDTPNKHPKK